jgi:DNA-directed RNA polymerase subunit RPC12/RpoP
MYGRYGNDHLSRFLMIVALILIVADAILRLIIPLGIVRTVVSFSISLAAILLYVLVICRSMSRNIYKRRRENETYLKVSRGVKRFLSMNTSRKTKSRNRDDAYYIFRDCTKCGATLRLPRKQGKHSVKCPKCSHSFYVKSK